jgi:hypothetical protein
MVEDLKYLTAAALVVAGCFAQNTEIGGAIGYGVYRDGSISPTSFQFGNFGAFAGRPAEISQSTALKSNADAFSFEGLRAGVGRTLEQTRKVNYRSDTVSDALG